MIDNSVIERSLVIRVVTLFVKENYTIFQIAEHLNIPTAKVLECLNNRQMLGILYLDSAPKIIKTISEKLRDYLIVNGVVKDYTPALNLASFYKEEAKQYTFLRHLALSYRLKLESLVFIFHLSPDVLLENLKKYNPASLKSLQYLFNEDETNQELAISKALNYCKALSYAFRTQNKEAMVDLIHEIDDYYVKLIKMKKNENASLPLTNEEIGVILNYQIKYNVSSSYIAKMFRIDRTNYNRRVTDYTEENPELRDKFANIISYYNPSKGRN